jgi:hypothetical protein
MNLPPIFAECVLDPENATERNQFLKTPFIVGEYVYASDGHILVMMRAPDGLELPRPEKVLGISKAWFDERAAESPTWYPLPEVPMKRCPECGAHTLPAVDSVAITLAIKLNPQYVQLLRRHGVQRIRVGPSPGESCYFLLGSTVETGIEGILQPLANY